MAIFLASDNMGHKVQVLSVTRKSKILTIVDAQWNAQMERVVEGSGSNC